MFCRSGGSTMLKCAPDCAGATTGTLNANIKPQPEDQEPQPQKKIHKKIAQKKSHKKDTNAANEEQKKKTTRATTVTASKRRRFSPLKYLLATQMCLLQLAQAEFDDWDQENSVVSLLTRRGIHDKGSTCWRPPFRVLGRHDSGLAHSSLHLSADDF